MSENINPTGLLSSSPIVSGDKDSAFGTHFDWMQIGGWRPVDTEATRDAIPVTTRRESSHSSGRRRRFMRVYCWVSGKEYQLRISDDEWNAATTDSAKVALLADNSKWVEVKFSGGTDLLPYHSGKPTADVKFLLPDSYPTDPARFFYLVVTDAPVTTPGGQFTPNFTAQF